MEALHFFKQLYSLDTLDTRLTTSRDLSRISSEPAKDEAAKDNSKQRNVYLPPTASPSRWGTKEFCIYYVVLGFVIPQMFLSVIQVSSSTHPTYEKYEDLLSSGWIPGRRVDNSDAQYSSFRNNIPYMAFVILIHPLIRRFYNIILAGSSGTHIPATAESASMLTKENTSSQNEPFERRTSFDLYFALCFLVALHGFSAFKVVLILYINYLLVTKMRRKYVPFCAWIFNVGILFVNEFCEGYHYASIATYAFPTVVSVNEWGSTLDRFGGLLPRWEILFNFTILRLISFDMDYYWSMEGSPCPSPAEAQQSKLSERERVTKPAPPETYRCFSIYLAYALYSPLYLAGPIITFNDYINQAYSPSPDLSRKRTLMYGVRFILLVLCMELMLHFIYTVAICNAQPNWEVYTPFQLSMLGFFNLHIVWLKLLIPFRFFRLWALLDGVDPPENVVRCMSDNYSALAFWRGWHRSFNRWIVRYIYIPLGGGSVANTERKSVGKLRGIANTLLVFTFVALWHDINLRLLMWGWLITLFVLPEILATMAFPANKWRDRPELYRVLCGVGAVANILMMMAANLVGFAIGIDGLKGMLRAIVTDWFGWGFLLTACVVLFMAVQIMFEVRQSERRKGVNLNF